MWLTSINDKFHPGCTFHPSLTLPMPVYPIHSLWMSMLTFHASPPQTLFLLSESLFLYATNLKPHFRPFLHWIKPFFESHLKFPSRRTMGQRIVVGYSSQWVNRHTIPKKSVILVGYYAAEATNKLYSRTQSGESCSIINFSVVSRWSGRTSTDWARGRLFLKLFCLHGIWNRAFRSIIMEFSCCSITAHRQQGRYLLERFLSHEGTSMMICILTSHELNWKIWSPISNSACALSHSADCCLTNTNSPRRGGS